jgi:hypothetical protein
VSDPEGKVAFLTDAVAVCQGEELCAIARLDGKAPLPKAVRVRGTVEGRPFERVLAIESPRPGAGYLPRTWAKLEIDRLLAEDGQKNKEKVVALSKAMYVMTPYTSLLVLENEAMYAQYKVDRGRKDHWALYPCPATIPVVTEPLPPGDPNSLEFYPPASALIVRGTSTIHNRGWNAVITDPRIFNFWGESTWDETNAPLVAMMDGSVRNVSNQMWGAINQRPTDGGLWFFTTPYLIQDGTSNGAFIVDGTSNTVMFAPLATGTLEPEEVLALPIQTGPPGIERVFQSLESDEALMQRIRQENRERLPKDRVMWQQARVLRQEALRSSGDARRKILDEAVYEQGLRPDAEKVRLESPTAALARARNNPPMTEVWSGRSLNVLLRHLGQQQGKGEKGTNVPLGEDLLRWLNLTPSDRRVNLGLLKNNGRLQWPVSLQGNAFKEAREVMDRKAVQAVNSLRQNKPPDRATVDAMRAALESLDEQLTASLGALSPSEYIEARRYLNLLRDAITGLQDANAARYFNANWMSQARGVADLVRFMAANALQFAPATPGDEPAYRALYQALAAYDAGLAPGGPHHHFLVGLPLAVDTAMAERVERAFAGWLAEADLAGRPDMWRRGCLAALRCGRYLLAAERLERAMQIEARERRPRPPAALWRDCAVLASCYAFHVEALAAEKKPMPADLVERVVQVVDHWRSLDSDGRAPCLAAAAVLHRLGERELAWDYLTTSLAGHGGAAGWSELARRQRLEGYAELADDMLAHPVPSGPSRER